MRLSSRALKSGRTNRNRLVIILALTMFHCVCGCSGEKADHGPVSVDATSHDYPISEDSGMLENDDTADGYEKELEIDVINRALIAEAISDDENSRSIRFILECLNTIGAGVIQSAESIEVEGEKAIDLIAEDGTNYRIYLSSSGGVESVKNLDTNEWTIQSER